VWYHNDDSKKIHVSVDGPEDPENWIQDDDVLDTWASSWLWPFAVHDWPDENDDLDSFYPTNELVTGPDIIFFWVARMIMAGHHFTGKNPFKNVYFTSILRDETGKKFSKSLGNSPDPLELFKEYGTDAVRFGAMLMAPQGLDVLFSNSRLEIGRNFMNKLWNASRFVQMNIDEELISTIDLSKIELDIPERWILNQLNQTAIEVNHQFDRFHFNEAAKLIYEFTWSDFCDWYIEIAKTRFYGEDPEKGAIAAAVSIKIIKGILSLLHPFAPFITEELWNYFKDTKDSDLIVSPWIKGDISQKDEIADSSITLLKEIVTAVRMIRSQMNVPPGKKADLIIRNVNGNKSNIESFDVIIKTLAKINTISIGEDLIKPDQSATAVVKKMELFVPLKGLINLDQEIIRLSKRLDELKTHLTVVEKKLANQSFIDNAPEKVVKHEKQKLLDMNDEFDLIKTNLDILK